MSSRMNGYISEREYRPSSEQMADLHVYLVPQDIWRDKFNNALNQNIDNTVSLGFIRVHPETKVIALRDEIEAQLGSDLIPKEYVFVKSVGRSLTRKRKSRESIIEIEAKMGRKPIGSKAKKTKEKMVVLSKMSLEKFVDHYAPAINKQFPSDINKNSQVKGRQENSLKAKNFLPPQAYAPELYLLEATPEVKALSEGSTRPHTRTSYDYEYQRQSEVSHPHAKSSHMPNGAGYRAQPYTAFPQSPSIQSHPHQQPDLPYASQQPHSSRQQSPAKSQSRREAYASQSQRETQPYHSLDENQASQAYQNQRENQAGRVPPSVIKTSASPRDPRSKFNQQSDQGNVSDQNLLSIDWEESDNANSDSSKSANFPNTLNLNRPPRDLRTSSNSNPSLDPSQHQSVSSPRRGPLHEKPSEEYPTPLSATPPHSASEKNRTGKQDEDSGIAGFTPETYRENNILDRRKPDSAGRDGLKEGDSSINDDSDRFSRSRNEDRDQRQDQDDAEQGYSDREQQRLDEEERRRREEEGNQKYQNRDGQDDTKLAKTSSEEDLTRYPSPPPLRLASPDRDSASARARRKQEKEELLKDLERAREARKQSERQREELVKHAKQMQSKTQSRRNHARDLWKKRYFDEKKKTGPLEEQCNRLRHELDILHKKLLATLEGPKEKATKLSEIKPSNKNNFKIQATRLQHEIEDVRRRVDHAKMKLTSEMKLRNQAETELRALRAELMQKKINLTLSRNSQLTSYAPPAADVNLYTNRSGITPRS